MAKQSPTQKAIAFCKREGYRAAVVEKWNPHVKIRQDVWGFVDIVALTPDGVLFIQATAESGIPARYRKITGEEKCREAAADILATPGCRLQIWGFQKGLGQPTIRGIGPSEVDPHPDLLEVHHGNT